MTNYIYAYTHVGNAHPWTRPTGQKGDYWIKVGQTKRPGLPRVNEQLNTPFPGLKGVTVLFHSEPAERPDGTDFTDHDVHRVLIQSGVAKAGGEWFEATLEDVFGGHCCIMRSP